MRTKKYILSQAAQLRSRTITVHKETPLMKRRTLLGTGLGVALTAGTSVKAQSGTTLTLVTDRPAAAEALATRLAASSGGAMKINVDTAPTTSAAGFLSTVGEGRADMYLAAEEAFVGTDPAFGVFSSMPGGMSPSELEAWVHVADGRFMWDILGETYGVKSFFAGDDGPMPLWSKTPLTAVSDLTGGRVGSIGLGVKVIQSMGASDVVDIRQDDVELASLDAFEGLNAAQMADAGLLAAFPHMTTPNAGRPSASLSAGVNMTRWDGLSEAEKLLLQQCITAEHGTSRALAMHLSATALQTAGTAVTAHTMPQDIWDAQSSAANTVMLEIIESGNLGADIGDAYLYFIGDVARWSEIGETAFFLGRKGALAQ